ncbi:LOW QUALITY PROTEIN: cilia- and flagella-associated protein 46 [Macrotis lagotis]|uniref:LOW QUALITY PROTEIN: cilia- and flagella-associated protein 46 n=1 Tax=Macrotis lagotis TaxID=92651 RepID=UPI003D69BF5E
MDPTVRQLLWEAEQHGDVEPLHKAYQLIKAASEGQCALDGNMSFSLELAVLCAEQALQMKLPEITEDCVNLYLKGIPPPSQFRGRAYLCQAQLYTPESIEKLDEFEKSVTLFMKAIWFAREDPRYYFLVYNASVLYWKMARAFLKPGHRQYLIPSLSQIVTVLDEIDEEDKDWQAELMIELLECYLEAGKMEEAENFCTKAAPFIKSNARHRYERIFSIMVQHKLMELTKIKEEIQDSISLSILFNINTLKSPLKKKLSQQETDKYLKEAYELLQQFQDQESIQDEKIPLLLELARLSLSLKCVDISSVCIEDLKDIKQMDPGKMIEVECLEYELEILRIDGKVNVYTRSAVEIQLNVIKRLNSALIRAKRLKNPNVIQVVCTTLWNLCLPLLQHNLRGNLLKPLIQVAEVLEEIDSLMIVMRCQVHIEIAHIEEDENRVEVAMEHLQKAMHLDPLGEYKEHLKMALNRLHLRSMLYQVPKRMEDKAVMAIEQAKKAKPKDSVRKKRALLVTVGLALAPDAFQIVLDGENESKVSAGKSRRQISFLCAKARHHTSSIDKVEGHLKWLKQDNQDERIYIWADLAKVARKQGVWDVCRTACRFCLLYDVVAKKMLKVKKGMGKKKKGVAEANPEGELVSPTPRVVPVDIQRIFAEVGFINAEAIIHFLQSEGIALNDRPVPPETSVQHHTGNIVVPPEEDAEWLTYSSWIENLSQYVMRNWLRSAEIGQEINEAWLVHNTVVYVLNHNHHLITAGRQRELLDLLQALLNIMKVTGHNGDTVTLVLLCNALARGIILPWIPTHPSEKGRRFLKSTQTPVTPLESSAISEIKSAIEVCDFGLTLTNGNLPQEIVPIGIRQQLIATWVKAKQLVQQQITSRVSPEDEITLSGSRAFYQGSGSSGPLGSAGMTAWTSQQSLVLSPQSISENQVRMTKVLVALEMYSCNGLGLMDFNLPSLSQVVKMASECMWTDPLVEIQSLVRLAHFAYMLRDHENVMILSKKVLRKADAKKLFANLGEIKSSDQTENLLRAELLSTLLCTQGKSIMENLAGRRQLRLQAAKAFLGSIRYASLAENHTLVMQSVRHYWNTCFPFFSSPSCRKKLKQSIQLILRTMSKTENKNEVDARTQEESGLPRKSKEKSLILHQWPCMDLQYSGNTDGYFQAGTDDDTTLKVALYELLFQMHVDQNDLQGGLRTLETVIQALPRTGHHLLIFKHIVMVKAKLGQNFSMEIQKFKDTSEDYLSHMWHCLAFSSKDLLGSLYCYYNAIHALQKPESTWKKIDYLLEFSEWLYNHQFPLNNILFHLDWAIDLLLFMKTQTPGMEEMEEVTSNPEGHVEESSEATPKVTIESLNSVRQLEMLAYAHILLALVSGGGSSQYEENCLMAYRCIMRIWEVSLKTVGNILLTFEESAREPNEPSPSLKKEKDKGKKEEKSTGKKGKDKVKQEKKEKVKEEEKNKDGKKKGKDKDKKLSRELTGTRLLMAKKPLNVLPASVEEWAFYHCHKDLLAIFVQDASDSTINSKTILKPNFSLYYLDQLVKALNSIYLTHLTLPILQFAVVISDLIIESKTLSDLYHLRLALVCSELRLSEATVFHEEIVGGVYINELEQASCRNEVRLKKDKKNEFLKEVANEQDGPMKQNIPTPVVLEDKDKVLEIDEQTGKGLLGISFPYLWMYKAEVLLEMYSYQPTWLLLAEAQVAFRDLGDVCAEAKCLFLLAELAKKELKYEQARKFIEKAQNLGGSEEFWYSSTVALTETLLIQENGRESLIPNIIQKTIDVFLSLIQDRPNRKPILQFLATSLEARSAHIQLKIVLDSAPKDDPLDFSYLLEAINYRLMKIEKSFLACGYKGHCVDMILQSVTIKRLFAKYESDDKVKMGYYLETYNLLQKAIMYLEEIFHNIQSLLALHETRNISTPLMRKLSKVKLKLAEISVEIIQFNQEKTLKEEMKKGTWEKILSDYLFDTSDFNQLDWDWFNLNHTVAHRALAQLESMQHLSIGCVSLRAKVLYFIGRILHLVALQTDPVHSSHYWDENILFDARMAIMNSLETDKEETEGELGMNLDFLSPPPNEDFIQKAREIKKNFTLAQKFRSQASEALLQCLQVCLNNNLISTAAKASLEMVEIFGIMDQPTTCQFLALYQSCMASLEMRKLLLSVTINTSSSQLAALLQLYQKLEEQDQTGTTLFHSVEQKLGQISKAWQNLCVTEQHFNILNNLPSNYQLIILQHSEDRSILYGMVYEKPKLSPGLKGKSVQVGGQCKVYRVRKDPTTISQMLKNIAHFREDLNHFLSDETPEDLPDSVTPEEEKLSQKFNDISKSLEDYLKPVFVTIHHWDARSQAEGGKKMKEKDQKPPSVKEKEQKSPSMKDKDQKPPLIITPEFSSHPVDMAEYLILIVDRMLMEMPLELAVGFENENITSVSREFSLQMLANHLQKDEPEISKKEVKNSKEGKQKSQKSGKRLSRILPSNCIPVESSNFKYVVDPFEEATSSPESTSPILKTREILDKYRDSHTSRWTGFLGSKNFLSQTDWEQSLSNCSGFFFYGMENLLSHVLIDSMITMNLQECHLMILLNLTQTVYSNGRRAKFEEIQRPSQLLLHQPVDTVILLSLVGVRAVMTNQWTTLLLYNAKRAELLMEELLKNGKPNGKAIYRLLKSSFFEFLGKADSSDQSYSMTWMNLNFVLFGLPNLFLV